MHLDKSDTSSLFQLLFPLVSFLKTSEIKWCRWTVTLFRLTYFTQWQRLRCGSHRLSSLMLIRTVGLFVSGKIYCSQHGFCAFMPIFRNNLGIRQAFEKFVSTLVATCELPQPIPHILELGLVVCFFSSFGWFAASWRSFGHVHIAFLHDFDRWTVITLIWGHQNLFACHPSCHHVLTVCGIRI